jgi:triosephosphate isomerase
MRRRLVVGNWKMNGSLDLCAKLMPELINASGCSPVSLVVCPPAPYLATLSAIGRGTRVGVGAQTVSAFSAGAFTGEICVAMLNEIGCNYAIVGHSERRNRFGETDDDVAAKARACVAGGVTPIVCVGETEQERCDGRTADRVSRQLAALIEALPLADLAQCVIAYEPVWAIGTGKTASPEQAQEVHTLIRERLDIVDPSLARVTPILYGGSVKSANAAQLFAMPDIDGGLIGGASLIAEEFLGIYEAANEVVGLIEAAGSIG